MKKKIKKYFIYIFIIIFSFILGFSGGTPFLLPDSLRESISGWSSRVFFNFNFHPGRFDYPALTIYLQSFFHLIKKAFLVLGIDQSSIFDLSLNNSLTLLVLFCCYSITLQLSKSKIIAIFSALLLASSPIWVRNIHYLTVDIPLASSFIFAAYLAFKYLSTNSLDDKKIIFLGIAIGVTTATKYNGIIIFFPLVLSIMIGKQRIKHKIKQIILMGITTMVSFLIINPFVLTDFKHFRESIKVISQFGKIHHLGSYSPNGVILHHLNVSLVDGYGLIPLIFAFVGAILITRNKFTNTRQKIFLISCPLIFFVIISGLTMNFQRHLLPIIPFLAIFTTIGFWRIWQTVPSIIRSIIFVLPVIVLQQNFVFAAKHNYLLSQTDTRIVFQQLLPQIFLENPQVTISCSHCHRYLDRNHKFIIQSGIESNLENDSADLFVFDSFANDRSLYDKDKSRFLQDPKFKLYYNYQSLYPVQISPYLVSKELVSFAPESSTSPDKKDIDSRQTSGPFIEIYFRDQAAASKFIELCQPHQALCREVNSKSAYYFNQINYEYSQAKINKKLITTFHE